MRRWPAEWETQSAVLLAWPHPDSDWARRLNAAERAYAEFALAILRFEPLVVVVRDAEHELHVRGLLHSGNKSIHFAHVAYNDTWIRDFGPITILENNKPLLLDFRFDGWGNKYKSALDDQLVRKVHSAGVFADTAFKSIDFVLEGGAIDSDGAGTVLTTSQYWRARRPALSRQQVEQKLARWLGSERVFWLEHGHLAGDDTDAHVDTLARFCRPDTIVWQACDDPDDKHCEPLTALGKQLQSMRTVSNKGYRLIPLPWPGLIQDKDERRLPASYANFLIINHAVLVPAFGVPADAVALQRLAEVFVGREVIGVSCNDLIWQNGGLHCAAMQLPASIPVQA